jgi:hypothetical protein
MSQWCRTCVGTGYVWCSACSGSGHSKIEKPEAVSNRIQNLDRQASCRFCNKGRAKCERCGGEGFIEVTTSTVDPRDRLPANLAVYVGIDVDAKRAGRIWIAAGIQPVANRIFYYMYSGRLFVQGYYEFLPSGEYVFERRQRAFFRYGEHPLPRHESSHREEGVYWFNGKRIVLKPSRENEHRGAFGPPYGRSDRPSIIFSSKKCYVPLT